MSADERRTRLVDAAIEVMTRDGVARATTRAIAAEAGMPLGVFHYAFRSKQELMAMVTETIALRSKADIDEAVRIEGEPDLHDLVHAALTAYLDHVVAHPHEHLVTYELTAMALREPGMQAVADKQYRYYLEENEKLVTAVAETIGFDYTVPVPVITRFVTSLMDGLALSYLARRDEVEAREVVALLATTLVGLAMHVDARETIDD